MRFDDLIQKLGPDPFAALPGPRGQSVLAPRPRRFWVPGSAPASARPAAGLVLLYPRDGEVVLLLTVRAAHLTQHRGQVSLPGGEMEAGETVEAAALREAGEEIGLNGSEVVIRGRLSPLHIPVSGFVLTPVVATAAAPPELRLCEREVARVIEVTISGLLSGQGLRVETHEREGATIQVPLYELGGVHLWGATAMIVAELLVLLGSPPDPWSQRPA